MEREVAHPWTQHRHLLRQSGGRVREFDY